MVTIVSSLPKITIFGHQIRLGNATLCHKDRYPLLLDCFLTSLRCIRLIGIALDRIFDPLMIDTVSFLQKLLSIFKQNNQFWTPDQAGKCVTVP